MAPWWLSIVISAVALTIGAIISFHIKFAPDAATAKRKLFALATTLLLLASNGYTVYQIVAGVRLDEPVTRSYVLVTAVQVGTFVTTLMAACVLWTFRLIGLFLEKQGNVNVALKNAISGIAKKLPGPTE